MNWITPYQSLILMYRINAALEVCLIFIILEVERCQRQLQRKDFQTVSPKAERKFNNLQQQLLSNGTKSTCQISGCVAGKLMGKKISISTAQPVIM